jgi:uncharacterized protein with PIN domain
VNLYAESSAVLAWLLDEPTAPSIRAALAGAEMVLASDLTLLECDPNSELGTATFRGKSDFRDCARITSQNWRPDLG